MEIIAIIYLITSAIILATEYRDCREPLTIGSLFQNIYEVEVFGIKGMFYVPIINTILLIIGLGYVGLEKIKKVFNNFKNIKIK